MNENGSAKLKYDVSTHFRFGENWREYGRLVTEREIDQAVISLKRLLGTDSLSGKTFLDIGCGSGLDALAAARMGAESVFGVDFDDESVETARSVISKFCDGKNWIIEKRNIFELSKEEIGQHDVVYSWGVLHHTGDMWTAIAQATEFVKEGGSFAIAIYRKTPFCNMWRWIKMRYSASPRSIQKAIYAVYVTTFVIAIVVSFRNPIKYIRSYSGKRGMKFFIDVRDWLGGFPYESANPDDLIRFVESKGFFLRKEFCGTIRLFGLFGTGCDEFLFGRA